MLYMPKTCEHTVSSEAEGKDGRGQENSMLLHEFKSGAGYRTGNSDAQQSGDFFKV